MLENGQRWDKNLNGVQVVGGSNPLAPTNQNNGLAFCASSRFSLWIPVSALRPQTVPPYLYPPGQGSSEIISADIYFR